MRLRRFIAASAAIAMITSGTAVANAQSSVSSDKETVATDNNSSAQNTTPAKGATPTPAEGEETPKDKEEEPKGLQNIGSIDVEFVQKAQAVVGVLGAALSGLVILFKAFPKLLDPVRNILTQAGVKF